MSFQRNGDFLRGAAFAHEHCSLQENRDLNHFLQITLHYHIFSG